MNNETNPSVPNALSIVRVISIVDTREYEEIEDGVFAPIPGSGDVNTCARCGRDHEVHATVELGDGSVVVVGTGCAQGHDLAAAVRGLKSGATTAKTLAKLRAERACAAANAAKYAAAVATVAALSPASVGEKTLENGRRVVFARDEIAEGVAYCDAFGTGRDDREERARCALDGWRRKRIAHELGTINTFRFERAAADVEAYDERIAKTERRLAGALGGK